MAHPLIAVALVASAWHVADWKGAPALFRGDAPEPPVLFWQRELERECESSNVSAHCTGLLEFVIGLS